jgi:hypothetical protein
MLARLCKGWTHVQIESVEADRSSTGNQHESSKAKKKIPMHQRKGDETCKKAQCINKERPREGKITSSLASRAPESWRGPPLEELVPLSMSLCSAKFAAKVHVFKG